MSQKIKKPRKRELMGLLAQCVLSQRINIQNHNTLIIEGIGTTIPRNYHYE